MSNSKPQFESSSRVSRRAPVTEGEADSLSTRWDNILNDFDVLHQDYDTRIPEVNQLSLWLGCHLGKRSRVWYAKPTLYWQPSKQAEPLRDSISTTIFCGIARFPEGAALRSNGSPDVRHAPKPQSRGRTNQMGGSQYQTMASRRTLYQQGELSGQFMGGPVNQMGPASQFGAPHDHIGGIPYEMIPQQQYGEQYQPANPLSSHTAAQPPFNLQAHQSLSRRFVETFTPRRTSQQSQHSEQRPSGTSGTSGSQIFPSQQQEHDFPALMQEFVRMREENVRLHGEIAHLRARLHHEREQAEADQDEHDSLIESLAEELEEESEKNKGKGKRERYEDLQQNVSSPLARRAGHRKQGMHNTPPITTPPSLSHFLQTKHLLTHYTSNSRSHNAPSSSPNALRSQQHQQAISLLEQCTALHTDWDTLKYEFAPSPSSPYTYVFNSITGKDDYEFAVLRDKIVYLVDTTKETLEGRSDASHTDVIRDLGASLEWMIRKARELKIELEGEGHWYRDGTPRYRVLGISKEPKVMEEGNWTGEGEMFELRSADTSFEN
ncbi:hypothetical protein N431DRAFT_458671 [Stipitochalara longipes BDJ]|nr:hypothetical protein N431DRAFT_458671 [Stipitochalara longipes BDJ]